MPTYEYRCSFCNESKSITISLKQDAPENQACESCTGTMVRQFGLAAVTFKGTGWASTDKKK